MTRPSGLLRGIFSATISLSLFMPGSAQAIFVLLNNDSFVSASALAEVYDQTGLNIFDVESNSVSQTFTTDTSVPGSFTGNVQTSASATDDVGGSITYNADASMSASLSITSPTTTVIYGEGNGGVSKSMFTFSDQESPGSGANANTHLDITFTMDTAFTYNMFTDFNGTGVQSGNFSIRDVVTDTTIVDTVLQNNDFTSGFGELQAGTYQLITDYFSNAALFGGGFGSYSGGTTTTLTALATPVPAAVWLFLSGLVSLSACSRVKTKDRV